MATKIDRERRTVSITYRSVGDLADDAAKISGADLRYWSEQLGSKWYGNGAEWADCLSMGHTGWAEGAPEALALAEKAVATHEQKHQQDAYRPVWDVSGAEVDVGAYLSGEPECMIDYPPVKVAKPGRVITLCTGLNMSGSISAETAAKRGVVIVALALALQRLGHSVEIWADVNGHHAGWQCQMRALVQSAGDVTDVERVMFALGHPGMCRGLFHPARAAVLPDDIRRNLGIPEDFYQGMNPRDPLEDLPEGTIYIPSLCSMEDIPDADEFLTQHLRELGLIEE
jgi:hypothetical protein